jgi:3D-(3,5/4)-trihydroxycyclohexane-1,2-dione acylhydrolase (decyclizing)
VVLGVGTRWSDFTTASRSLFGEHAAFINLNVAPVDAFKHAGLPLIADARAGLEALAEAVDVSFATPAFECDATVERAYTLGHEPLPAQSEVIGVVNRLSGPRGVVVCAAGSMPGDLHKLWRTRDPKGYHVEYGFSCMGYEIAGGLGVKMAAPDREVFVMVGDGSYLMMAQELVTAVQEGIKLVVVLVQNHGYQSIGALSESVGSQRFGTRYRYRGTDTTLPVDLAQNAAGLGAQVLDARTIGEFEAALRTAITSDVTTVVQVHTDPLVPAPSSEAWWDVPVAEVASLESTRDARRAYERNKATQKTYLRPPETVRTP